MAIFFGIPAILFTILAIALDNSILMCIGISFVIVAGAIWAFDQL
jgi:hypothetical protein